MTPMPATPASGWQSSSIDVVDAIVLSPHSDNPTKSLTHAICLNLSAKLSAVLHRRSAPSYVCAGAGAGTVYKDGGQGSPDWEELQYPSTQWGP